MTALARDIECAHCGATVGQLVDDGDGDFACALGTGCATPRRRSAVRTTVLPTRAPMAPHQELSAVEQVRAADAPATHPTCAETWCWARVDHHGDRCLFHFAAAEGFL